MGDTSWLIYEASTTLIPKTRQGGKTTDLGPLRTHRRKNHLQNPSALNAAAFGTHPAPRPGGSVSGMQGRLIYEGRRPTVTEEKQEAVTAASAPGEAPVGVNALSPRRSPRKHRRKQLLTLRRDRSPVSSTHPPGGDRPQPLLRPQQQGQGFCGHHVCSPGATQVCTGRAHFCMDCSQ